MPTVSPRFHVPSHLNDFLMNRTGITSKPNQAIESNTDTASALVNLLYNYKFAKFLPIYTQETTGKKMETN